MSVGLVCPQCGHVNIRAGVFCAQCGGKMTAAELEQTSGLSSARLLRALFRWIPALALAAVIGLMAWPGDVPNVPANEPVGSSVAERVRRLREAAAAETSLGAVFGQQEINEYLAWRLSETGGEGGGLRMSLERLHISLDAPHCTLRVLGGLGPGRLTFTVRVRPEGTESGGRLHPEAAWIGHLPVPRPLVPWIAAKVAPVFAQLGDERRVLAAANRLDLRSGELLVAVGPR